MCGRKFAAIHRSVRALLHTDPAASLPWRLQLTADEQRVVTLREETQRHLSKAARWAYFATLTHARDASDATVLRAFLEWRRQLARDAYRAHLRIGWVYAPQARDVLHVHALVAPHEAEPVELHEADLAAAWTWGSVDVQPVTEPIGAAAYLLKHTSLTEPDIRRGWDLNVACDRRNRCRRPNRRGGAACLFAPGAWST